MDNLRNGLSTALLLLLATAGAVAETSQIASSGPSERVQAGCVTAPAPEGWSESEKWAWDQICNGGIADFDARYGTQEECKRQSPDRFAEPRRKLRAPFLRTYQHQAVHCGSFRPKNNRWATNETTKQG